MTVQHLLLARDGTNQVIEKDSLKSHLVIAAKVQSTSSGHLPASVGHHVEVKKHFYSGDYYAVAIERNTDDHEINQLIESTHLPPI